MSSIIMEKSRKFSQGHECIPQRVDKWQAVRLQWLTDVRLLLQPLACLILLVHHAVNFWHCEKRRYCEMSDGDGTNGKLH